jgi:hypothetical protein
LKAEKKVGDFEVIEQDATKASHHIHDGDAPPPPLVVAVPLVAEASISGDGSRSFSSWSPAAAKRRTSKR